MKSRIIITTTLRSFLIQSSMNFERMHNIGVAYILLPIFKKIHKNDQEKLKASLKRHLEFYNCHPYMSSFVLGVIIKLEEKLAKEELQDPQIISQVKSTMMGTFGALGDSLFWKTLRPLAAVISLCFAVQGFIYAPLIFLLLYNIPHLTLRIAGLYLGYKEDVKVIKRVQSFDINSFVNILAIIGILFSGILFQNLIRWEKGEISSSMQILILIGSIIALKKRIRPLTILATTMVVAFIIKQFI